MSDDEKKNDDDKDADKIEEGEEGDNDSDVSPDTLADDSGKIKDVISALAQMNIVLSEDTNVENFLSHIHQALLTAAAHRGEDNKNNPADGADKTMVADPGMAGATALSLEMRGTIAWAENMHRQGVSTRLRALLDNGRCQPAEFKARQPQTQVVKLSLDNAGKPLLSDLEKWIESREAVPKGTFWEPAQKTRMSATVEAAPEHMQGEMSEEERLAAVDWALGRKPRK
jgi:hypothetical protein